MEFIPARFLICDVTVALHRALYNMKVTKVGVKCSKFKFLQILHS